MQKKSGGFNKRLIGFVIGGTILGVSGLSKSEKGRGVLGRFLNALSSFFAWMHDRAKHLGEKIAESTDEKNVKPS